MENENTTVTTIPETSSTVDGHPAGADSGPRYYSRFSAPQRFLHGFLLVTFLGLAITGLTLRFSGASWAAALAPAAGGFGTILFFHLFCAVVLTLAFLIHVGNLAYRIVFRKEYGLVWGPSSMVPNWKDIQDFIQQLKWLNIALLIHGEEAILAVGFIFTIHFFNTHLRPDNFPMDMVIFTGRQTEEELKHRHPVEYRELVESGRLEKLRVEPPPRWLRNFGWLFGGTAILIGFVFLTLMVVAFVKE